MRLPWPMKARLIRLLAPGAPARPRVWALTKAGAARRVAPRVAVCLRKVRREPRGEG